MYFTFLSHLGQHQNNQSGSNQKAGEKEAVVLAASPPSLQFTLMTEST